MRETQMRLGWSSRHRPVARDHFMVDPPREGPRPPHVKVPPSDRQYPEACIPWERFRVDSFSSEDQERLRRVVDDVDFCEAANRREQIVAARKILRPTDAQSRCSYAGIDKFVGGLAPGVIEGQDKLDALNGWSQDAPNSSQIKSNAGSRPWSTKDFAITSQLHMQNSSICYRISIPSSYPQTTSVA
jgi:hypothetical protein